MVLLSVLIGDNVYQGVNIVTQVTKCQPGFLSGFIQGWKNKINDLLGGKELEAKRMED